jgi:hypothetical protein
MTHEMRFSQHMRLIWIDATLVATGHLNRADICDAFGISTPQASLDLRAFQGAFPDRMVYDHRAKLYRRASTSQAYPTEVRYAVHRAVRLMGELRHAG